MTNPLSSWLSGPQSLTENDSDYRGQGLGLPESGPGSISGSWRRVGAMLVDWLMSYGIAVLLFGFSGNSGAEVLGVWFVVGVLCVSVFAFTPGQFVCGICVVRVDNGRANGERRVSPVAAFFRNLLIAFIVPPLMNDPEGRGLHDRATKTAVIRSR